MDPFAQKKPPKPQSNTSAGNPFARALAETEHSLNTPEPKNPANPFSEALARTGGRMGDSLPTNADENRDQSGLHSQADLEKQREEMERKQKKEALKKKLHAEINPTNMKDVFDARKKKTQQDLENVRKELQALAQDISRFQKEVDIATFQQIVEPGQEGVYYTSFLQQLRNFIMLLRKKVQSARTWMQQSQAKQAKKKKKGSKKPGMEIGGGKQEQTKTVFDTMHHERSSSYGGS